MLQSISRMKCSAAMPCKNRKSDLGNKPRKVNLGSKTYIYWFSDANEVLMCKYFLLTWVFGLQTFDSFCLGYNMFMKIVLKHFHIHFNYEVLV